MTQLTTQLQALSLATEFLSQFPREAYTLRLLYEDTTKDKREEQPIAYELNGTLDQHKAELVTRNREGYGVFLVVNESRKLAKGSIQDEDVTAITALFTDYDGNGAAPPVYDVEPSFRVQTSENKEHAYFLVSDCDVSEFKENQGALAIHYKTDKSIVNPARVMRVPGTYNMKQKGESAPFLARFIMGSGKTYTASEVLAPTRKKSGATEQPVYIETPREVIDILALFVTEAMLQGHISNHLYKAAKDLGKSGHPYDACLALVKVELVKMDRADDPKHLADFKTNFLKGQLEGASKSKKKSSLYRDVIGKYLGADLKRNAYGSRLYYKGLEAANVTNIYLDMEAALETDFEKVKAEDLINYFIEQPKSQWNPLQDAMNEWASLHDDPSVLDEACDAMKLEDTLQRKGLKNTLKALVARTIYPGCKVDTIFLVKGSQGTGKTSMFENWLGMEYYRTYDPSGNETNEKMKANECALLGLDEVGGTFSKREINSLKQDITTREDTYRVPYAKHHTTAKRHYIGVGTTNENELLKDSTGNRRFIIVTPTDKIDTAWFRVNRERLFGTVTNILNRELEGLDPQNLDTSLGLWWFVGGDVKLQAEANEEFDIENPYEDDVLEELKNYSAPFKRNAFIVRLNEKGLNIRPNDSRATALIWQAVDKTGEWSYMKRDRVYVGTDKLKLAVDDEVNISTIRENLRPFVSGDRVTVAGKEGTHVIDLYYNPDGTEDLTAQPIDDHGKPTDGAVIVNVDKLTLAESNS